MSDANPSPDLPADEPVDPAWWADVRHTSGTQAEHETPDVFAIDLERLAVQAAEDHGAESLRARTLTVLAKAASPLLEPEDWTEPFKPAMQFGARRSVVPEDLSPQELALLGRVAPLLETPALRARVADIAWTYGDRENRGMLQLAIDSYLAVPLDVETWLRSAAKGYRRALELALRRGKAGRATADRLAADLFTFVLAGDSSAGWVLIQASELLAKTRRVTADQARAIAAHFLTLAATVPPPQGRGYARQASSWLRSINPEQALEALEVVAELYVVEAEQRPLDDRGAFAASLFLEKALASLRDLPRKYRTARSLEPWLRDLQRHLADLREQSLEEMAVITSDPVDITTFVHQAEEAVSGVGALEALVRLTQIAPLIDARRALEEERERATGSISRLFGGITLSTDARKVATQAGSDGREISDDELLLGVISTFAHRVQLVVQAQVYPALQVVALEHHYDLGLLTWLCMESPSVPSGHERLWARGLQHGLAGDFASAVSVLVPQIEQLIRRRFKAASVNTLHVTEDGVETEKSLGALLEMSDADKLLGTNLTLELRALLCEQLGPNLRNDLAHGLVNDPQSRGAAAIYAWWHCLRMVVIPYYNMVQSRQPEPPSPEPGGPGTG